MNQQNTNKDNRSASQKITDLENALIALYGTADTMARDLLTIKEILKVMDNKVNSIIKASASGEPINDAVVSKIMVDNSVEELKERVSAMVSRGQLVAAESATVNSFIVGHVEDLTGAVTNPRFQFAVSAHNEQVQKLCVGAKTGDLLKILVEPDLMFKVLEIYNIQGAESVPAPAEDPSAATEEVNS